MKFIIKICLILFCSLQAKAEFDGKWYKLGTNWQIYINITSTKEGQILEQYMKVADNQNLVYSKKKIIHKYVCFINKGEFCQTLHGSEVLNDHVT